MNNILNNGEAWQKQLKHVVEKVLHSWHFWGLAAVEVFFSWNMLSVPHAVTEASRIMLGITIGVPLAFGLFWILLWVTDFIRAGVGTQLLTGGRSTKIVILDVAVYVMMLLLIRMKCETFWAAWWDPYWFFWLTNITLLTAVLAATLGRKWVWYIVTLVVVFIFCNYFGYDTNPGNQDSASGTNSAASEQQQSASLTGIFDATSEKTPIYGEGMATKTGLKVYLDPRKSRGRPMGHVKYTSVKYPTLSVDVYGPCAESGNACCPDYKKWWSMPAGEYLVTSEEPRDVFFRWN